MRLSYSSLSDYRECPKRFDLKQRKVDPPAPEDKYYAVFGTMVQKFYELYINQPERYGSIQSREEIAILLRVEYELQLKLNHIKWKGGFDKRLPPNLFYDSMIDCIWKGLTEHKLPFFPEGFTSETKITVTLKSGDTITGVLDFLGENVTGLDGKVLGAYIVDGKTTGKVGKNVNKDQLYMYAFLYWAKTGKLPDRVAFYYFKLGVTQDIEITEEDFILFRKKLVVEMAGIKADTEFKATPSNSSCKYCPYAFSCEEYQIFEGTKVRKPRPSSLPGVLPLDLI